ncbi:HNH endonuclease [Rathayibacter sp. Leaf248]|uniref:HNH endonuclease n=1 Tax=Rathayibacter sp. Leaf248 TaxID=2876555 RepID=UPI001E3A984A|nr:hypothetical protein [Rathayibacter sp. Leaf248]
MPTGWRGSTRKQTLPPDWPTIRRHVLERDGHRCQHIRYDTGRICGAHATDCDHLEDRTDHRPENLAAKCSHHHDEKTNREAGYASGAARRAKRDAAQPQHPGLLTETEQRWHRPAVPGPHPF